MIDERDARVVIGYVKGPRGVRGEIRITSMTDIVGRFELGQTVYIDNQACKIISSRESNQKEVLLFLEGILDRSQVEDLSGKQVMADPYDSTFLPPDTYFHYDLIGLQVQSDEGVYLGEIIEVIETGANDVYVIHIPGHTDILIPAILSIVMEVNIPKNIMLVKLPEGLNTRK